MRRRTCDTCEGGGEVLTMVPGSTGEPVEGMVECPDCQGEGSYVDPSLLDRTIGGRRADQLRALRRRSERRVDAARELWRDRDAQTVGAYVHAHRNLLQDEPRLRATIQGDLAHRLAAVTPLGWRRVDLRWALENARRAVRGEAMAPLPYDEVATISMSDQNPMLEDSDYFIRGQIVILGERRRVPAGSGVLESNRRAFEREAKLAGWMNLGRPGHRLLMGDELQMRGMAFWSPWRCTCGEASGTGSNDHGARIQFEQHLDGLWPAYAAPHDAAPEAVEWRGRTIWVTTAQAEAFRAAQQAPHKP